MSSWKDASLETLMRTSWAWFTASEAIRCSISAPKRSYSACRSSPTRKLLRERGGRPLACPHGVTGGGGVAHEPSEARPDLVRTLLEQVFEQYLSPSGDPLHLRRQAVDLERYLVEGQLRLGDRLEDALLLDPGLLDERVDLGREAFGRARVSRRAPRPRAR